MAEKEEEDKTGESESASLLHDTRVNLQHRWSRVADRMRSLRSRAPLAELAMLLATFVYALQTLIGKVVEREVAPMEVVLVRSFLAGLITLATIAKQHHTARKHCNESESLWEEISAPANCRGVLLFRALLGAIAFSLTYAALKPLGVALHTTLFFLHPIASALLGWPVLGERIGWLEAVSLLFCAGGTLLVVQPAFIFDSMPPRAHDSSTDGSKGMGYTLGVITQLCSALFAAGAMMAVRYLGKKKPCPSVLAIALWFHGVSSLTGAFVLALPVGQSPSIPSWRNAGLLIAIACTSFIGQYLLTVSYAKLRVAVAGGLSYLQVAFSFIVGVTILDEAFNVKKVSGAVAISIGGVLVSYAKQRREQKQQQQQHQQQLPIENNRASESKQLNGVSFGDSNSVQQGEKQSGGSIELQEQKYVVQADSPYEEDYPTNAAGPKKREIALREEASLHER